MNVVDQLKTRGFVTRGALGVIIKPVDDDVARALKLGNAKGAIVVTVTPGSAGQKAGLREGDVILSFNGHPIDQGADLPPLVAMTKPGTSVPVDMLREGKRQTVQVVVGTMPRDKDARSAVANSASPRSSMDALGLTVEDLDAASRTQLGVKAGEGVAISDITGQVAAQAGLQPGDVILMVNQQRVGSAAAFKVATANLKPGDTVLLLVRRGDSSNFIPLTVPAQGEG